LGEIRSGDYKRYLAGRVPPRVVAKIRNLIHIASVILSGGLPFVCEWMVESKESL
jgi:hypothetical protein